MPMTVIRVQEEESKVEEKEKEDVFLEVGLDLSHVLVTIGLIACVLFFFCPLSMKYGLFLFLPPCQFSDLITTLLFFSICEVDLGQRPLHRSRREVLGGR